MTALFSDDNNFYASELYGHRTNPAVGNEEAMRRAVQVFYIMNEWAKLWLDYEDKKLTAENVVDMFNDILSIIGCAYKFEMQMDSEFLIGIVNGYEDLLNKIAAAEASNSEENN